MRVMAVKATKQATAESVVFLIIRSYRDEEDEPLNSDVLIRPHSMEVKSQELVLYDHS